jgi:shikimate dehydrogenase
MRRACVIGDPIAHSRSPLVHGFWLRQLDIRGYYGREHVRADKLERFIKRLGERGYVGCNVTLPHKEAAFRIVDEPTELARSLAAVNTIWLDEDGRTHGDNTDVYGFLANLDQEAPAWRKARSTALVLGAGGSARAVVAALERAGVERIAVANRSLDRAQNLARHHGAGIEAIGLDEAPGMLGEVDLLVNTTSLGMAGEPDHDTRLDGLKPTAIVADLVYVPLETPLLAKSRAKGHQIVGGLGMLLHQAVPGFERWFGLRPQVTAELRNCVAADILANVA